jgi:hypothetical protein
VHVFVSSVFVSVFAVCVCVSAFVCVCVSVFVLF